MYVDLIHTSRILADKLSRDPCKSPPSIRTARTSLDMWYVLAGVHVTRLVVFTDDRIAQNPGDLWFFPAGMPHSLQATNENPDGAEFLLVSELA